MPDQFELYRSSLESPAWDGAEITPNNNANLPDTTHAIWVGGSGYVSVVMASGKERTFPSASGWMPLRAKRVKATGTTATGIIGVW